jgi:hypothetical protein
MVSIEVDNHAANVLMQLLLACALQIHAGL